MSISTPPVGANGNFPDDKKIATIRVLTTKLAGINQQIQKLDKTSQEGGVKGIFAAVEKKFYTIQQSWFTYRLTNLQSKITLVKDDPVSEKTDRVSHEVLDADSATIETKESDAVGAVFDDFAGLEPAIEAGPLTKLDALKERLSRNLALKERIAIRDELIKMPEARQLVADQQKIIDNEIVRMYRRLVTSPDLDKAVANLYAEERQEIVNNKNCTDERVNKKINEYRADQAAKDVVKELKNGNKSLYDGLLTRNKSILPTAALFKEIFIQLVNADDKEKEQLVTFAADWVKRNKGSVEFAKARSGLDDILELGLLPEGPKQALIDALALDAPVARAVEFTEEPTTNLKSILDGVEKNLLKPDTPEYRAQLASLTNDLLTISRANYERLTPDDLAASKWGETPPAVQKITEFSTYLTRFVQFTILSSNDADTQKRYGNMFIDLADSCLQQSNIDALMALHGALSGIQTVDKTNEKFQRIDRLLSNSKNYAALHEFYELKARDGVQVVPFIGQFQTQMTFAEDNPAIKYDKSNLAKLEMQQDIEHRALRFQTKEEPKLTLATDLRTRILNTSKIDADDLELRRLDLNNRTAIAKLNQKERSQYDALLKGDLVKDEISSSVKEAVAVTGKLQRALQAQKADKEFTKLKADVESLAATLAGPRPQELERFLGATSRGTAQQYFAALQKVATGEMKARLDASELGALVTLEAKFKKINDFISGERDGQT